MDGEEMGGEETVNDTNLLNSQENPENSAVKDDLDRLIMLFEQVKSTPINLRKRILKPPKSKLNILNANITLINESIFPTIAKTITDITELNNLTYACALLALEKSNLDNCFAKPKKNNTNNNKQLNWQNRLKSTIETIRKEINMLNQWDLNSSSIKIRRNTKKLQQKYKIHAEEQKLHETEKLKQKLAALNNRLKRYEERQKQYHQNFLFENYPQQAYRQLRGNTIDVTEPPTESELEGFWKPLYETKKGFNKNAKWISEYEDSLQTVKEQTTLDPITEEDVSNSINNFGEWKAPGPDQIQAYFWKKFSNTHTFLGKIFTEMITNPDIVPDWLVQGRTLLFPKKQQTQNPSNYRPVTCLPIVYKIMSSIINRNLQKHIHENDLMPEEQKGCAMGSLGCTEQLLIDLMLLEDCKNKQRTLSLAWIDYQKAFDSVPHEYIIKMLKIHKFNTNIINFFQTTMNKWKTNMYLNFKQGTLQTSEIKFDSGIFQGDNPSSLIFCICLFPLSWMLNRTKLGYLIKSGSQTKTTLSHLLLMDDLKLFAANDNQLTMLLETVSTFSQDISMNFGLDKCSKLSIEKGNLKAKQNITLNSGEIIKELDNRTFYKYLGMDETSGISHKQMKEKLTKEYMTRLRKILKSSLNSINKITAINTFAIPSLTYGLAVINWTHTDAKNIDIKTRKILTAYNMLHKRSSIERLYLPRNEGGRGLLSIETMYKRTIINTAHYILSKNTWSTNIIKQWDTLRRTRSIIKRAEAFCLEIDTTLTNLLKKNKHNCKSYLKNNYIQKQLQNLTQKPLHGQYQNLINQPHIDKKNSLAWLKDSRLKGPTEGTIIAIQDQAIKTKYISKHIHKTTTDDTCRLCKEKPETIHHVISACPALAPTEYLKRHNKVATYIYCEIGKQFQLIEQNQTWYNLYPTSVLENNKVKLLWDFPIQTDKAIVHNKPDIIFIDKENRTAQIIDIAIPNDNNTISTKLQKVSKYTDLSTEIQKSWNLKQITIIPIVVGATGVTYRGLQDSINSLPAKIKFSQIQKIAIIGTAFILRKFLNHNI